MATITVASELDVLSKYKSLVANSLDGDSVYIRMKETLAALSDDGDLKDSDRSKIIAEVMSSINTSIANSSMSTALQWATSEKETELKKLELAKQLDILDKEDQLKAAQIAKMKYDSIAVQAQTIRMYGTPDISITDGSVSGLSSGDSKLFYDIEIAKQQDINLDKEANILDSKLKESYVSIHKVVADTYTNYGTMNYNISAGGVEVTNNNTSLGQIETLSSVQKDIAKEQAKGYSYSAWANALTGTSSMLGTALASGLNDFGDLPDGSAGVGKTLVLSADNLINKLGDVTPP